VRGAVIGVGPALKQAREHRGLTIDEASRDTRIRTEFLHALEEENFDMLLGDVYVRGCLRSYSSYLGLDANEVVSTYADRLRVGPAPAPAAPARLEPALRSGRKRDNHRLAFMVAATLLVLAAAFGILSKSRSAPAPALLPSTPPPVAAMDTQITVALTAVREVQATVTSDGIQTTVTLHPGEGRSFFATRSLTVQLSSGGVVDVVVNGKTEGRPGKAGQQWKRTFEFETASPPSGGG